MRLALAARQAGTAWAWRELLAQRPKSVETLLLGAEVAVAVLEPMGPVARYAAFPDVQEQLERFQPDILVTGTSLSVEDDAAFWAWARRHPCPSVAFVDQWTNPWQRFALDRNRGARVDVTPDAIAIVDERTERDLLDAGCPRGLLRVTGSPALDAWTIAPCPTAARLRAELVAPGEKLILLVSEPPHPPLGEDDLRRQHGFSDRDALQALITAIDASFTARGTRGRIVIRPHPRDDHDRLASFAPSGLSAVRVDVRDDRKREAVLASDLVGGMRSMLLLEAATAGIPVVSCQLHRRTPSLLTDERPGIRVATNEAELRTHLDDALVPWSPPEERSGHDLLLGVHRMWKLLEEFGR